MSIRKYTYGRQSLTEEDIDEVISVLRSDWLTQGPAVQKFESALSEKFGASNVIAVANGTAALHLTALAFGWKTGDIVITTPVTFAASANSVVYTGATPDFVDIDPDNYTINVNKLEDKIISYKKQGKNVKAVVAVDYAGNPSDWKALKLLAEKYNLQLVNDNCHAPGAEYKGDYIYAAKYADAAVQSYHPVKHITTGEGGAVFTNNKEIADKVKLLRTHGITKDPDELTKNDGPWYHEMQELGFNYRLTDFQSALGVQQLKKLDKFISERRNIARYYDKRFSKNNLLQTPAVNYGNKHAYHLYPLLVDFKKAGISKTELFKKLAEENIYLQVHYLPVHLHPFYRKNFGYKEGDFPEAERFYGNEVSIPMHPGLTEEDLLYISDRLEDVLEM